ncbi:MAG: cysteine--tRNA ligase [Burkholderiales bacterium]
MLKIYNTLTRGKDEFKPQRAGEVRMYVCGMTVYDYCHLGHARVWVVFDTVRRWLRTRGYRVIYVRNITDIDDKIILRAAQNHEPIESLTARFIDAMDADVAALGVEKPDYEPRATQYVANMVALIQSLLERRLAYALPNGDVYFAVREFAGYGKLSGKSLDELRAGERVEVDANKRDALDFALWKAAKPGEPEWDAPWGRGRPGWHIECSAMGAALLGEHFDIHGGGQDLQFPHHENEIAQSEGAFGHRHVNYWMHNGFVRVEEEKMSKSLGNFFTLREILRNYDAEVVRFFVLRAHYRSPLNYSDHNLDDARQALTRLYTALKGIETRDWDIAWDEPHARRFGEAMDDDFNTPEALAVLFELANVVNRDCEPDSAQQLKSLGGVLGLLQRDPAAFLQDAPPNTAALVPERVEALIAARLAARRQRNYPEADRIRQQLLDAGVVLEDSAQGTAWRRT